MRSSTKDFGPFRLVLVALLALGVVVPASAGASHVTTYTVSRTDDAFFPAGCFPDGSSSGGSCTLREAIFEANKTPADVHVQLSSPGPYVLDLGSDGEDLGEEGDLDITERIEVTGIAGGPSLLVQDDSDDRVFDIHSTSSMGVILENLEIADGDECEGGGIRHQGGGLLTLNDVVVRDNYAGCNGGGLYVYGAAVVDINGSAFRNNEAEVGGGMYLEEDPATPMTVTIDGTLVDANDAEDGDGGGVYASFDSSYFTMTDSTITANVAYESGGGVYVTGDVEPVFSGVNVTDNEAQNGSGGGIYVGGGSGTVTVNGSDATPRSAVARNTAVDDGDSPWGGGVFVLGHSLDVTSTDIDANVAGDPTDGFTVTSSPGAVFPGDAVSGSPESNEFFLDVTTDVVISDLDVSVDLSAEDAGEIGLTIEHVDTASGLALRPPVEGGTPPNCFDGIAAIFSDGGGSGACSGGGTSGSLVGTVVPFGGSLDGVFGGQSSAGTWKLTVVDPCCAGDSPTTLTSWTLTFNDGQSSEPGEGGGIAVGGGSDLWVTDSTITDNVAAGAGALGGGVYTTGSTDIEFTDVALDDNTAELDGGGVYAGCPDEFSSDVDAGSATISGNVATSGSGGGLWLGCSPTVSLGGVTVAGNTAAVNGGGAYIGLIMVPTGPDLYTSGTDFTDNHAGGNGGALWVSGTGEVFLGAPGAPTETPDFTASGNTADGIGGFLYRGHTPPPSARPTTFITNGEITGNSATDGGAIWADAPPQVSGPPPLPAGPSPAMDLVTVGTTFASNSASADGGAIYLSGEPYAGFFLSVFDGNTALGGTGGAIYSGGGVSVLQLTSDTFTVNVAGSGGALYQDGGRLWVDDSWDGEPSFFGENRAESVTSGGALWLGGVDAVIKASTFDANSTDGNGGAIWFGGSTTLALDTSVLSNNAAGPWGGGVYLGGGAHADITHTTFGPGNTAAFGAGLYVGEGDSASVLNSTASGNTATVSGGGIYVADAGATSTLETRNVTVAENAPEGVATGGGPAIWSASHTLVADGCAGTSDQSGSEGYNLDAIGTSCAFGGTDNLALIDPLLGPLADNGGFAPTHALLHDSPAIDAGLSSCTDFGAAPLTVDQRFAPRPIDGDGLAGPECDIGAFEAPPSIMIDSTSDAFEEGEVDGDVTFSRTDASGDLDIVFEWTGDATRPDDFDFSASAGGTVTDNLDGTFTLTMESGTAVVSLIIDVVDDPVVEMLEETVTVHVLPNQDSNEDGFEDYLIWGTETATVTIHDNDVWLVRITSDAADDDVTDAADEDLADGDAAEPADDGTFTIIRSSPDLRVPSTAPPFGDLEVELALGTSTAAGGTDYTALPGTITIPDGEYSVTVPVSVIDDLLIEDGDGGTPTLRDPEVVLLQISAPTAGQRYEPAPSPDDEASVAITDDDAYTITVTATDGAEGGADGSLTVKRAGATPDRDITVTFEVTGDATGGGTDYTLTAPAGNALTDLGGGTWSITILDGETTAVITVDITDDTEIEADETVTATLTDAGATFTDLPESVIGSPGAATSTIVSDDEYTVTVTTLADPVSEDGDTGTLQFERTGADLDRASTVTFSMSGTATLGTDYTLVGATDLGGGSFSVTFGVGVSTVDVTVDAEPDFVIEADEAATATITDPGTDSVTGVPGSDTVTVEDDDGYTITVTSSAGAGPSTDFTDSPGAPIPPVGTSGTTIVSQVVAAGGTISDLDVTVDLDHTFLGDLDIFVRHVDSGTEVQLFEQSCGSEEDLAARFDDEAAGAPVCDGSPPSVEGTVTPVDPLAAFDGETLAGTWELRIVDNFGGDAGTLNSWTLHFGGVGSAAEEGPVDGLFTFLRSGADLDRPQTITFDISGDASLGSDYVLTAPAANALTDLGGGVFELTFETATSTVDVTVDVTDDTEIEDTETSTATITDAGPDAIIGSPSTADIDIVDNDFYSVSVTAFDVSAGEPNDNGVLRFSRVGADFDRPLTVTFEVDDLPSTSTATLGDDYELIGAAPTSSFTVVIPSGDGSADVTVDVLDDLEIEETETVEAVITDPGADAVVDVGDATVEIADNDFYIVNIAATDPGAAETDQVAVASDDNGTFRLTRSNADADRDLVVTLEVGGDALRFDDYELTSGAIITATAQVHVYEVTIPNGDTSVDVTVDVLADTEIEDPETVTLTVLEPAGVDGAPATHEPAYVPGPNDSDTVTIADDDFYIVAVEATDADAAEPGDDGAFTFTRSNADADRELDVVFAMSGSATEGVDYAVVGAAPSASFTVTFPVAVTEMVVAIEVLDDSIIEGPETAIATITDPGTDAVTESGAGDDTVTITSEDFYTVTVTAGDGDAAEPDDDGALVFKRSGAAFDRDLVVFFDLTGTAVIGDDYTLTNASPTYRTTIRAGQAVSTVSLDVVDDEVIEDPESAVATLRASGGYVVGAPRTATVDIADNDPTDQVIRLGGEDRFDTSRVISGDSFDDAVGEAVQSSRSTFARAGHSGGAGRQAGAVVLSRSDLFPDALSGTVLAVNKDAPLLLTKPGELHPLAEAEIQRVLGGSGTVYLLGGESALGEDVAARLRDLGYDTVRLGGATRYETAVLIAEEANPAPRRIFITTGLDFPDALAAGATAAKFEGVVVLSEGDVRRAVTDGYLSEHPTATKYAIGGPAAAAYPERILIFGDTRFETASELARRFFEDPVAVGIARGDDFADSLGGGAHIGHLGGPLLLTPTDELVADTELYLRDNADAISVAYIYGGPAAVEVKLEVPLLRAIRDE